MRQMSDESKRGAKKVERAMGKIRWRKEEIGGKIAGKTRVVEEQGRKWVEGSGKSKRNKMTEV